VVLHKWPVSIAFVQLSLALAHNHEGLILTWEGHGQGGLLCWFKVKNRSLSTQYLGNSGTESRTWRTVMMAAFNNKHVDRETYADASAQEMRTGGEAKGNIEF
jgi:hypothetical protein